MDSTSCNLRSIHIQNMTPLEITAAQGLPGVRVILPPRHRDGRGFFSEVWREDALKDAGIDCRFFQENHALSHAKGTVLGLHFQIGAVKPEAAAADIVSL
jgi:dTDP-4-dehydrorhamnose 3,5-epimerase-like enzyme